MFLLVSVVDRIMVPKDIHTLIPRTCENVPLLGRRDLADVMKVMNCLNHVSRKMCVCVCVCVCVLVAQLSPTLCDPTDSSLPGQTRILEWVAISSPGDLPNSGIKPLSPALVGEFFTTEPLRKPPRVDGHHQKPEGGKEGFCLDSQREHGHADTLIWDFGPLALRENKFWLF